MHLPKSKIRKHKFIKEKDKWFCQETLERKRTPIRELEVWWHCANMPGAEYIVREQLDLIKKLEIPNVHAVVLGPNIIDNPNIKIEYHSNNYGEFEHPSIQRLYESACVDPDKGFLYWHTKGASAPQDPHKTGWRKVMTDAVIVPWRANFEALNEYDLVGANWQSSNHFPGNFWFARGDWISHLDSPVKYRAEHQYMLFAGQAWDRMHAELWLGQQNYHAVKSLVTMYECWWTFGCRGMN